MFASLKNFACRHKGKFLSVGLLAGGVGFAAKYAAYKLDSWQKQQAEDLFERQSLKSHYDKSLVVTRTTLVKLLPKIRRMVERELDSNKLLEALKDHPEDKRRYWEELKLVAFGRAVCCVLCTATVAPMTYVMMVVLSANTMETGDGKCGLSGAVQAEYLKVLEDIIEQQLPKLLRKTMGILSNAVATLPLNSKLTLPQLSMILDQISLLVMNNGGPEGGVECGKDSLMPLSRYVMEPTFDLSVEDSCKLSDLYYFTVDVFGTEEFLEVATALLKIGCAYILDFVSPIYHEVAVVEHGVNGESVENDGITNADSSHPLRGSEVKSVHVVKLIPVLNSVVQDALPLTYPSDLSQLEYVNKLCMDSSLEQLAYTVYNSLVLSA